jgi:esterase/lipase
MAVTRPKLIIVPGIGDDTAVYYSFAKRWKRLGYDAHVISFTWADIYASLKPSMTNFLSQLDQYRNEPIYMIGISAGGTAVVNALALRNNVKKVITVCSPFNTMAGLRNPLLQGSIAQLMANVEHFSPAQKQRILSVHGLYDQVVNVHLSQTPGVKTKRLWSIIHAPTIYLAMTLYARRLDRFFKMG